MFRIECFCDDKNLAKLKWALFELGAYNVTDQPVRDSQPNGRSRSTLTNDDIYNAFLTYAKKNKLNDWRATDFKTFAESQLDMPPRRYFRVINVLRSTHVIRKTGKGMHVVWKIKMPRAAA
jgi:hypothetical protein